MKGNHDFRHQTKAGFVSCVDLRLSLDLLMTCMFLLPILYLSVICRVCIMALMLLARR